MELFITNLPYELTESELNAAFAPYGKVLGATIVTDRETGRSRGFGFVRFAGEEDARRAISEMNGRQLKGRELAVKEARQRGGGDRPGSGGADASGMRTSRQPVRQESPSHAAQPPETGMLAEDGFKPLDGEEDYDEDVGNERKRDRARAVETIDDKDRRRKRRAEKTRRGKRGGGKRNTAMDGKRPRPPRHEERARDWDWRQWDEEEE